MRRNRRKGESGRGGSRTREEDEKMITKLIRKTKMNEGEEE